MKSVLPLLLLAGACSAPVARPVPAPQAPSATCPAGAPTSGYDLWPAGDRCEQLDRQWAALPGSARECATDRDCRLITGPCFTTALRTDAVEPGQETPCVHPAGGMCPPSEAQRAVCAGGCCAPAP